MSPFQSLPEYEKFVYTLQQRHASILQTTLTLARRGQGLASLTGELHFSDGFRLVVFEILTWDKGTLLIQRYGYEAWQGADKLYWYDPQPHPNDAHLARTHPHHKHVHPDTGELTADPLTKRGGIKRNRIPAPFIRFDRPNLPFLIEESEGLIPKSPGNTHK